MSARHVVYENGKRVSISIPIEEYEHLLTHFVDDKESVITVFPVGHRRDVYR